MTPASRVALSRACQSCIKAKRKCSLETPLCSRCGARNLRYVYANELSTGRSVTVMEDVPASKFLYRYTDRGTGFADDCGLEITLHGQEMDPGPDCIRASWREFAFSFANNAPPIGSVGLSGSQLSCHPVMLTLDRNTMQYMLHALQSLPRRHYSMYMHRRLVGSLPRPSAVAKVIDLLEKASGELGGEERERILQDLEARTRELIAYTHRAKPDIDTLLVCVQALLGAEFTLAIGHPSPHAAEATALTVRARQLIVLSQWCWSLWEQAPWTSPNTASAEEAWLFGESVRRTLIVAHFLCDIFAVLNTGVFRFSGFVSTLPYDARTWLWKDGGHGEDRRSDHGGSGLQSFRQFIVQFEDGLVSAEAIDDFEALLLVACKGYRMVSSWMRMARSMPDDSNTPVQRGQWSLPNFVPFQ